MVEGEDGVQIVGGSSRILQKQFWGRHMWARGYFCCSSGNVSDEMIAEYIANQSYDRDDDFKVEGLSLSTTPPLRAGALAGW